MPRIIFITLVLLLTASGQGQAIINSQPDRFDLEPQPPGSTLNVQVQVRNDGDTTTHLDISVVTFEQEHVTVSPSFLHLDVGESQPVNVTIHLSQNTSGGRHDIRLTLTESARAGGEGIAAQTALRIPIIFDVPNLKVAGTQITDAAPGADGEVTAMVFNYNDNPSQATVEVTVRDETDTIVLKRSSESRGIASGEHVFIVVPIPTDDLDGGVYRIETRASGDRDESNTVVDRLLVGIKRAEAQRTVVEPLGDGRYRLQALVENIGTVPLEVDTYFQITTHSGELQEMQEVQAQRFFLGPGEHQFASTVVSLQGEQQLVSIVRWDGGQSEAPMTKYVAESEAERTPDNESNMKYLVYVGLAVGIGGIAYLAGRKRRR